MNAYDPQAIEPKWQQRWLQAGLFRAGGRRERPKYYQLEMFPYPSGRLHMGHVRNYSIGDVMARFQWMRGRDVLHPIGWDAFGMPAENAALAGGQQPAEWTYANIAYMRRQLQRLGFSYDWDREVATCRPEYYRWEQLVFLKMYERGLAYKKRASVNWCPKDETVLANEQVQNGCCWRCGTPVVLREIEQWFFRITDYAEELLGALESLEGRWPERVLAMQRHWIGKSQGARLRFALAEPLAGVADCIEVFTTRPDTLYGATFLTLAAEHPLALPLARRGGRQGEVSAFIERVRAQRGGPEEEPEKEGVFTGACCINPVTGEKIPIWVANFVLMEYGTGAVMAVPAHDQRDFEFAKKYELPIVVVIEPEGRPLSGQGLDEAWEGAGKLVSSGPFGGLSSEEAKAQITQHLEGKGLGAAAVTYRLRDWLISRQRYWGAPIPVVYCEGGCGVVAVPEKDLPVELPLDVTITGTGGSPLARHESFLHVACPRCGGPARRESDTMDTFVESSWYFLRYLSPRGERALVEPADAERWMPVDQYVGGVEHAVMHLLYARFFTLVLRDLGMVPQSLCEPFGALLTQGMVCKESYFRGEGAGREFFFPDEVEASSGGVRLACDGQPVEVGRAEKMSKSKKNVVDPDALIAQYGADTARLFCLFAAPPERDLLWDDTAVEGCSRFLARLWRLVVDNPWLTDTPPAEADLDGQAREIQRLLHKTIKAVTDDLSAPRFHFNTAISRMQELINALYKFEVGEAGPAPHRALLRRAAEVLLILLHPFCPHITDELWRRLGREEFLLTVAWPPFDAALVADEQVAIAVQVNGRLRATLDVARDAPQDRVRQMALEHENVRRHLGGKDPRKVVYVPGRILNLVV